MPNYEVGLKITHRCLNCYHDEQKILKVTPNEFSEKTAYMLWTQCTSCGQNDTRLAQSE